MLSRIKRTLFRPLALVLACSAAAACNGFIFEDEGDCSVTYRVKFRYDMNMKYADAFSHEVHAITLYAIDQDGNIVWKKSENGAALAAEDYSMVVDVPAGKYDLLAWCDADEYKSWNINADAKTLSELGCSLKTKRADDGTYYTDTRIDDLYHAWMTDVDFTADEGETVTTMSLTKNTNQFQVILQHLSGSTVDPDRFEFFISADNAVMDWSNALVSDESVNYRAWAVSSGTATTKAAGDLNLALAELTTGRLIQGHSPRLVVRLKSSGATVLSVPLIDYALLVKGHYNGSLTDQEYLDRQDGYNMIFFLDESERWIDTYIYINSWKVVLQDTNL
jgi:hypothetical protein